MSGVGSDLFWCGHNDVEVSHTRVINAEFILRFGEVVTRIKGFILHS